MHAKHRNGPENGYRSNVMGMGGVASASRMPPEGRGHRMYNSDYRNYNRGGGGGGGGYGRSGGRHSKQFQQPAVPPRGADIFVDAGKLAAEYLVSKGVLPPSALPGKWQSDGLKNPGSYPGFRSHKVEMHADGRGSIHSRLGNAGMDAGPGRRRYSDDHGVTSSRSSVRERKRTGSFRSYGLEANRELGRSGSWSEKINDAESDASVGRHDERPLDKDGMGGARNPSPGQIIQEVDSEAPVESGFEKSNLVEEMDATGGTPGNCDAADGALVENSDENKGGLVSEAEVVKEGRNDDLQKKCDENKGGLVSEEGHVDLVKHSKIVHVPTRARSSLTVKNSKCDQDPLSKEDENIDRRELPEGSVVHVTDVAIENSASGASSNQNPEFESHQSDIPTMELERSNSMLMERGEKRAMEFDTDVRDDVKKLRQWVPVLDAQPDGSSSLSDLMEKHSLWQEPTPLNAHRTVSPDQKGLDIPIFPKDHADSCEFMEEKQLFPGLFKTCDLNLVGNGDVSENRHGADHRLVSPSVNESGRVSTPIDIDLSISNNGNLPKSNNGKNVMNANEIEVIDLEKDSTSENKTFSNPPERRGDTDFTDLDGFVNSAHNGDGIPDVQDGYRLMISELLGNDSPNVPADLNSLHNPLDLSNAEGILGDDDSIYMSLGEIPISLLGPWEQPSQDYGKPF